MKNLGTKVCVCFVLFCFFEGRGGGGKMVRVVA